MKPKIVKNKKTGKIYVYDAERYAGRYHYDYSHKSTRGKVLVSAKGRVNKANVEELKAKIDANADYTASEKLMLKADLDAYIRAHKNQKTKGTTTGFFGWQKDDQVSRMFSNAGYTTEQVINEINAQIDDNDDKIYEADLLNADNWNRDTFEIKGKKYKFEFTYTGDILTRVE